MSKLGASLVIGGIVIVAASLAALGLSWAGYRFDLGAEHESTYLAGAGLLGFMSTLIGVSRVSDGRTVPGSLTQPAAE